MRGRPRRGSGRLFPDIAPPIGYETPVYCEFGFDSRRDGKSGEDGVQRYMHGVAPGDLAEISVPLGHAANCYPHKLVVTAFEASGDFLSTPLTRVPVRLRDVRVQDRSITAQGHYGGILVGLPPTLDGLKDAETSFSYRNEAPLTLDERKTLFRSLEAREVMWPAFEAGNQGNPVMVFENVASFPVHIFGHVEGETRSYY